MGIVFPCHPLPQWGLMEISMTHPLKLPYLDTWGSRLISCLEVKDMAGQLTCLKVKAICLIWKTMCFWRSRLVIWLPWLNPLSLSFWSQLCMKQHLICDSLIQTYYISKLIKKYNKKNAGNQGGTVSSVGTGKENFTYCQKAVIDLSMFNGMA